MASDALCVALQKLKIAINRTEGSLCVTGLNGITYEISSLEETETGSSLATKVRTEMKLPETTHIDLYISGGDNRAVEISEATLVNQGIGDGTELAVIVHSENLRKWLDLEDHSFYETENYQQAYLDLQDAACRTPETTDLMIELSFRILLAYCHECDFLHVRIEKDDKDNEDIRKRKLRFDTYCKRHLCVSFAIFMRDGVFVVDARDMYGYEDQDGDFDFEDIVDYNLIQKIRKYAEGDKSIEWAK